MFLLLVLVALGALLLPSDHVYAQPSTDPVAYLGTASRQLARVTVTTGTIHTSRQIADPIECVAANRLGGFVLAATEDNVTLYNSSLNEVGPNLPVGVVPRGPIVRGEYSQIAIDQAATFFVIAGNDDNVYLYRHDGGTVSQVWSDAFDARSVAISWDGRHVAAAGPDGVAYYNDGGNGWSGGDGTPVWDESLPNGSAVRVDITKDSTAPIVVLAGGGAGTAALWDDGGTRIWDIATNFDFEMSVALNPAGTLAAVGADNRADNLAGRLRMFSDTHDGIPGWDSGDGNPDWTFVASSSPGDDCRAVEFESWAPGSDLISGGSGLYGLYEHNATSSSPVVNWAPAGQRDGMAFIDLDPYGQTSWCATYDINMSFLRLYRANQPTVRYHVPTSGRCQAVSASAYTTLQQAAEIYQQPSDVNVCLGSPFDLDVGTDGSGTLTYQWRKDGSDIAGATSDTYSVGAAAAGDVGVYDVVVSDFFSTVISDPATVTLHDGPTISAHPQSATRNVGQSVTFSVTATSTLFLSYQWLKNGNSISGATSSSYTIASVTTGSAGNYNVRVSNTCDTVTSNTATLTVQTAPVITSQPQDVSVIEGQSASFSVAATGFPTPTYAWRKNGQPLGGETDATLAINPVFLAHAGTYDVVVTNDAGSVTSDAATLSVCVPVQITTPPQSTTVNAGDTASFSVSASGTPTPAYQWYEDGDPITGATQGAYEIVGVDWFDQAIFHVVVSNGCGTPATSAPCTLTVISPPLIQTQPEDVTVPEGTAAQLEVTAVGTPTLTYQWQKWDGLTFEDIAGEVSSIFAITMADSTDSADYRVIVHNGHLPNAESDVATIHVLDPSDTPSASARGNIRAWSRPNPFNPATEIGFELPFDAIVSVKIYDSAGRSVQTLLNEPRSAGVHRVPWNATARSTTEVASGIYFCSIQAAHHEAVVKLVLLK